MTEGVSSPIGFVPAVAEMDLTGLDVAEADVAEALMVNPDEWRAELPQIEEWFDFIGEKLPTSLRDEFESLKQRLADADRG
jgi:phosphoenolpyruvate carboxykinase (GTP)